jgi:ribose 5-phosphate isomerase B
MKVFLGADHAGFTLKQALLSQLPPQFAHFVFEDCGTGDTTSVDYPDFARAVAEKVVAQGGRGILVCGSGIGMAIAANKVAGIRAAQAWDATSARLSRQHNDANILCLGERLLGVEVALEAARVWLGTEFLQGRHVRRLDLIRSLEA